MDRSAIDWLRGRTEAWVFMLAGSLRFASGRLSQAEYDRTTHERAIEGCSLTIIGPTMLTGRLRSFYLDPVTRTGPLYLRALAVAPLDECTIEGIKGIIPIKSGQRFLDEHVVMDVHPFWAVLSRKDYPRMTVRNLFTRWMILRKGRGNRR